MKDLFLVCALIWSGAVMAAAPVVQPVPTPPAKVGAVSAPPAPPAAPEVDSPDDEDESELPERGAEVVTIREDARLAAGGSASQVVAVVGSAYNEGAAGDVVAVFGDATTTATGSVDRDIVAVLGDVKLDGPVGRDVVAVLGSVELGPNAKVGRDLTVIGGTLKRDPAAATGRGTHVVTIGKGLGDVAGLRAWIRQCLMLGRPLAFDKAVGWAWGVALTFLALYVLLAALFRNGVERCVQTFETRPGASFMTALLSLVLIPFAFVVILITIVGVPFLAIALFALTLFGKAIMLAWMGRRVLLPIARGRDAEAIVHPALAVLVGGVIALLLYTIPVFGGLLYKLLDFIGLAVVLLTIALSVRASREARSTAAPAAAAAAGSVAADAAPLAATAAAMAAAPAMDTAAATAAPAPATAAATAGTRLAPHAGMARATFWQRMGALLLDFLLVTVIMGMLDMHSGGRVFVVTALYGVVMWVLKSTTVGGSVLGLQVVRLDGKPLDWGTSFVRGLGCLVSAIAGGLGFIWIAIDDDKQAWHDKIAGTVVVRNPGGATLT